MKKFCIVFIVLALAVMIPYAALAATYDFSDIQYSCLENPMGRGAW